MSKHILIIEDERYLAEMYKLKFEHEGYRVTLADNGNDGLAAATRLLPDLILLDIIIPGPNGREVLKELKSHELTKRIKIIMISNLNQDEEVERCYGYGADGFLVKANLTPTELCERVAMFLDNDAKKADTAKHKPEDDKPVKKRVKPRHVKVLLIEDQEEIIEIYKVRMEKEGFDVEVAKNGAWGLKLAKEKEYNAIIMDIVMPAMNGLDMLGHLRADSMNKEAPIIVLSNSAQDGDIEIAKKHGASAYLLKSKITPARLVEEVEKLL